MHDDCSSWPHFPRNRRSAGAAEAMVEARGEIPEDMTAQLMNDDGLIACILSQRQSFSTSSPWTVLPSFPLTKQKKNWHERAEFLALFIL